VFENVAEEAVNALREANHDRTVSMLNAALRVMAACQQRLQLRTVSSTLQASGDVAISTVMDAAGKSSSPYAIVDRLTRQLTVTGKAPAEPGDEGPLPDLIDPKG
jgi:hypothetical protein